MNLKTIFILFLTSIISVNAASGQMGWKWATVELCTGESSGLDVVIDSLDNIYVTGYFRGQTKFGDKILNCVSDADIFISKLDKTGKLCWIKQFGTSGDNYGTSITLDDNLNVYVTGNYKSNDKTIVLKLDNSGNIKWQKFLDRGYHWESKRKTITSAGDKIFVASADSIYLFNSAGEKQASKKMNFSCVSVTEHGEFIAANSKKIQMLDTNLSIIKEYNMPLGIARINALSFKDSNFYFTGMFNSNLVIGDSIFNGNGNMFITKMDAGGVFRWANHGGGNGWDMGNAIVVNSNNQIFVTGLYRNIASFDNITVGKVGWFNEIFLAEYDHADGRLLDFINAGGDGDNDIAYGMAESSDNQLIVTGSVDVGYNGLNFGDILFNTRTGNTDYFLAKTLKPEIKSSVSGQVLKNGIPTYSIVKLYKLNADSSAQILYNMKTGPDGKFDLGVFSKGTYILKTDYYISNYLNTYYGKEYRWDLASRLKIESNTPINSLVINLIELPIPDGTNTITGTISDSIGLPKRFIDVLLVSKDLIPVAHTRSDTTGLYKFEKIPNGDFTILVDTVGLYMDDVYTVKAALKSSLTVYDGYDYILKRGGIFTRDTNSSVNEPLKNNDVLIYPVPTHNLLYFKTKDDYSANLAIDIIDFSGKIVKNTIVTQNSPIDVSDLQAGTYIVRIFYNNSVISKKIILIK